MKKQQCTSKKPFKLTVNWATAKVGCSRLGSAGTSRPGEAILGVLDQYLGSGDRLTRLTEAWGFN